MPAMRQKHRSLTSTEMGQQLRFYSLIDFLQITGLKRRVLARRDYFLLCGVECRLCHHDLMRSLRFAKKLNSTYNVCLRSRSIT